MPGESNAPAAPPRKRDWRYWLRLVLIAVVWMAVLGYFGFLVKLAFVYTSSNQHPIEGISPADLDVSYEPVAFIGADDLAMAGWYVPSQNGAAVILLHGYAGDRTQMLVHMHMLVQCGYGVLLFDQRACGESEGEMMTWGWREVDDVPGAVAFVEARADVEPGRIGILGTSTGAEMALIAAAEDERLQAVVADGPWDPTVEDLLPPRNIAEWWRGIIVRFVYQIMAWRTGVTDPTPVSAVVGDIAPRPILFISTGEDIEQRLSRHYHDLAGSNSSLWELPDAPHSGGPFVYPEEYESRIVEFFDQALLDE